MYIYFSVNKPSVNTHWARHNRKAGEKAKRSELKTTDQIYKARMIAEKKRNRNGRKGKTKRNKK